MNKLIICSGSNDQRSLILMLVTVTVTAAKSFGDKLKGHAENPKWLKY